jgi:steroid delta-isomerase-like uncharacterized protein
MLHELPPELHGFAERWLDAWNRRDPRAIAMLCVEDVSWEDPALPEPLRGRSAVTELLEATFRAFPDLEFRLTEPPLVSGDQARAAVPWKVTGTMRGDLDPPGLGATGRRLALEGVDLYDLREGLIVRMRTRYDVLSSLRQLGAAPPAAGLAERALLRAQRLVSRVGRRRGR